MCQCGAVWVSCHVMVADSVPVCMRVWPVGWVWVAAPLRCGWLPVLCVEGRVLFICRVTALRWLSQRRSRGSYLFCAASVVYWMGSLGQRKVLAKLQKAVGWIVAAGGRLWPAVGACCLGLGLSSPCGEAQRRRQRCCVFPGSR
ncbi:hypothetical protein TraAM80_10543 [Trypanosoma rangeli]|uniref:Uncharacterized protein n=1 Tax=Trypanosoma rangeli TaxID=5698 RepID=A0A3R7KI25_TRYRA|nr:uncharacterized protein TraAM80_10543 [Trypanosoma rangeli]RNE94859.1 hypothetical protein TraAM80_10543 [Trypanosoma rangeli]|eukprot:RNE94859.1 hypothetical protein TraAM80_10543 [Trypanosoma rangeli]